jgi:hypothetical protein
MSLIKNSITNLANLSKVIYANEMQGETEHQAKTYMKYVERGAQVSTQQFVAEIALEH